MAVPIEIMVNISPIEEPYARLARLYTSQNDDPRNETLRMIFSSSIQNALACKITPIVFFKYVKYQNRHTICDVFLINNLNYSCHTTSYLLPKNSSSKSKTFSSFFIINLFAVVSPFKNLSIRSPDTEHNSLCKGK